MNINTKNKNIISLSMDSSLFEQLDGTYYIHFGRRQPRVPLNSRWSVSGSIHRSIVRKIAEIEQISSSLDEVTTFSSLHHTFFKELFLDASTHL